MIHEVQHEFFEDHAQAAGSDFADHGLLGDGLERVVAEFEAHVLEFEEALILLDDRVLGARQDFDQGEFVEVFEHPNDR